MKTTLRLLALILTLTLSLLAGGRLPSSPARAGEQNPNEVIAYAGPDAQGKAVTIKTIHPDGSHVQTLYTTSQDGAISDVALRMVVLWSDTNSGPYREIIPAFVDVQTGQHTNLGTLDFVGQID